jgi:hypothetical protein
MGLNHSSRIVTDGLVLCLDAANIKSYKNYNLATYSQDFTNAVWVKSTGLVSATGLLAPDNTFTASTLTDDLNNNYENWSRSYTIPNDSASYNISIFIKKTTGGTSTRTGFNVSLTGGTTKNYNVRFNADTGVAVSGDTNLVTSENNSFWRLSFTVSNNGTGNTTLGISYYPATGFYNSGDDSTATGSHTVWGVQVTRGTALLPYRTNVNDSADAWNDLSSIGNNGTLFNGIGYNTNNIGSLTFDGLNDYITLPSQNDAQAPLTGFGSFTGADTNAFSIELWIKTSQIAGSASYDAPCLVGRDSGDIYSNLTLYNGYVYWAHYNLAWLDNLKSTTLVSDNNWHHVVYVNNTDETGSIYIDGKLEVTSSSSLSGVNYFSPDYIGRGYSSKYFSGSIGNVKFYAKSLSTAEIQQNFNALRGRFGI